MAKGKRDLIIIKFKVMTILDLKENQDCNFTIANQIQNSSSIKVAYSAVELASLEVLTLMVLIIVSFNRFNGHSSQILL